MNKNFVVRDSRKIEHFTAGDTCSVAEVMHPVRKKLPFGSYSLAHATVAPHGRTAQHKLVKSSETYYILSGHAVLFVDGEEVELSAGRAVAIAPSAVQHIENESDEELEFLCIVTPPWSKDDEKIM